MSDDNPQWQCALSERRSVDQRLRALAAAGVRLIDPARIWIDEGVVVHPGATLWGGCVLRGQTEIGGGTVVHPGVVLEDTRVGNNCDLKPHSVCTGAVIGDDCAVGPHAHLRPGATLARDVRVGNFVEVKKATLGEGVRAGHLSYLGDADIGSRTNVGAGTITCNYDGHGKHRTEVGEGVFIGSNSSLVAPVRLGAGTIVGAGSTVSRNVPDDALVVERAEEKVLKGYAPRLHAKNRQRASEKKNG